MDRGIRMVYNSHRESKQKGLAEVYQLRWKELDPIRVKPPRHVANECIKCSKTLTPEDRSAFFLMDRGNDNESLQFVSLYRASKKTGISICALRNACKKENLTITQQKGGTQMFKVYWSPVCFACCPKTKKSLLRELTEYSDFLKILIFSMLFQDILYYIILTLFLKALFI